MEQFEFNYPAKRQVLKKSHVGVVGSGDLEVLLEPANDASAVRDYAKLGLLYRLLHVSNPEDPNAEDVSLVRHEVIAAIQDARKTSSDLINRTESEAARVARKATRLVRARLQEQCIQ